MTREQEIKEMAKVKASHITSDKDMQVAFADALRSGAEWADAHPHWISVEDKLPNNYERVIAAFGRHFARICFHCGDTWYLDNPPVAKPMSGITHWMPLPPPPKEGGEEWQ